MLNTDIYEKKGNALLERGKEIEAAHIFWYCIRNGYSVLEMGEKSYIVFDEASWSKNMGYMVETKNRLYITESYAQAKRIAMRLSAYKIHRFDDGCIVEEKN